MPFTSCLSYSDFFSGEPLLPDGPQREFVPVTNVDPTTQDESGDVGVRSPYDEVLVLYYQFIKCASSKNRVGAWTVGLSSL